MFAQVITARVLDRAVLSRQMDLWESDLLAGAEGFVGATSGVTDDGRLVVIARFESEEEGRSFRRPGPRAREAVRRRRPIRR